MINYLYYITNYSKFNLSREFFNVYYEAINIYILFDRISRVQNIVKFLINYLRTLRNFIR